MIRAGATAHDRRPTAPGGPGGRRPRVDAGDPVADRHRNERLDPRLIRRGDSRGFTLIEIMVALLILGIMSALGYGTYRAARISAERTEESLKRSREIDFGMRVMVQDFARNRCRARCAISGSDPRAGDAGHGRDRHAQRAWRARQLPVRRVSLPAQSFEQP